VKRARRTGVGTKKGRALKTLTKLLNTRPFLYSRDEMPRLREERNEPEEQEDRHKRRESGKLSDKHKNSTDIM